MDTTFNLTKLLRKGLVLASLPLLLAGCGNNDISSSDPLDSTSSTNENTSLTISESEFKNESEWNDDVAAVLYEVLGDYYSSVPCFHADSYDIGLFEQNQTGILTADLTCYGENAALAMRAYTVALKANDFTVYPYEDYTIAFIQPSLIDTLILQYEAGIEGNEEYVRIFAYVRQEYYETWPYDQVEAFIGIDLPSFEDANRYQFAVTPYGETEIGIIGCFDVDDPDNAASDYAELVQEYGFSIVDQNSGFYYTMDEENGIELDFGYDYESNYFHIQTYMLPGSKYWPSADLEMLFPSANIPAYEEQFVRYESGLGQSGATFLYVIYCLGASEGCEAIYQASLEEAGWIYEPNKDFVGLGKVYSYHDSESGETTYLQFEYDEVYSRFSIYIPIVDSMEQGENL